MWIFVFHKDYDVHKVWLDFVIRSKLAPNPKWWMKIISDWVLSNAHQVSNFINKIAFSLSRIQEEENKKMSISSIFIFILFLQRPCWYSSVFDLSFMLTVMFDPSNWVQVLFNYVRRNFVLVPTWWHCYISGGDRRKPFGTNLPEVGDKIGLRRLDTSWVSI